MTIRPVSLSGFGLELLASYVHQNTTRWALLLPNALPHLPSTAYAWQENPPPTWEAVTAGLGKGK